MFAERRTPLQEGRQTTIDRDPISGTELRRKTCRCEPLDRPLLTTPVALPGAVARAAPREKACARGLPDLPPHSASACLVPANAFRTAANVERRPKPFGM
eukprot:10759852-Alexandrium_andersonii.AAC.1